MAAALRFADRRLRWFELGLWGALAAAALAPLLWGEGTFARVFGPLQILFLGALALASAILASRLTRRNAVLALLISAAIAASVLMGLHDWAGWQGWIDFDRPSLSQFAPPLFAIVLGALLVNRHLETVAEVIRFGKELEARVAQRTEEVERTYQRLREMEREQATVRERQRIMADMHDGLGASLVGLLSLVQGGKADSKTIERRAHDALQELRLAVDSLEIPEGDLTTALGTVRHRLRDPLAAAGIELQWEVGDLPRLEQFGASRILNLQRILLEAVTNAVRHSGAQRIVVATRMHEEGGALVVSVEDDGRGIDLAAQSGGRGMMTMQRRAATLGGRLQVGARPGGGTRIELVLRWPLPHPPES